VYWHLLMPLFAAYATLSVALTRNRWKQRLSAAHFIQEYTSCNIDWCRLVHYLWSWIVAAPRRR